MSLKVEKIKEALRRFECPLTKLLEENDMDIFQEKILKINWKPYKQMYYYTCASKGEISGLGKVKVIDDEFIVTDVLILKQECNPAHTELDEEKLSQFIIELDKQNKRVQDYNLWWHSHNDFGVSWSGEDTDNIARHSNGALLFSICMNKDADMIARMDESGATTHLPIRILPTGDFRGRGKCIRRVKRKVTMEGENDGFYETEGLDKDEQDFEDFIHIDRSRSNRKLHSPNLNKNGTKKPTGV